MILTVLMPGFFIAMVSFHLQMVPTDLALSIIASKLDVPFSTQFEVLVMPVGLRDTSGGRAADAQHHWTERVYHRSSGGRAGDRGGENRLAGGDHCGGGGGHSGLYHAQPGLCQWSAGVAVPDGRWRQLRGPVRSDDHGHRYDTPAGQDEELRRVLFDPLCPGLLAAAGR